MTSTRRTDRPFRPATLLLGLLLLTAAGASGGCYQRVVSAKGVGADQYQVSEPYQESSRLDRWFYGEQPAEKSRGGSLLNR